MKAKAYNKVTTIMVNSELNQDEVKLGKDMLFDYFSNIITPSMKDDEAIKIVNDALSKNKHRALIASIPIMNYGDIIMFKIVGVSNDYAIESKLDLGNEFTVVITSKEEEI